MGKAKVPAREAEQAAYLPTLAICGYLSFGSGILRLCRIVGKLPPLREGEAPPIVSDKT